MAYKYKTIKSALERAEKYKKIYDKNLKGKTFAFLYIDKSSKINVIEVKFERKNYLHLTGLDYKHIQFYNRLRNTNNPTEAVRFYERLGNDSSLKKDVHFPFAINNNTGKLDKQATRKVRRYVDNKLENLSQLTTICSKAEYIGKYKGIRDFDYVVGKNNSAVALQYDKDVNDGLYFPPSSLSGDKKHFTDLSYPVLAIFSKNSNDLYYNLNYLNKKVTIGTSIFSINDVRKFNISSFDRNRLNIQINDVQLNNLFSAYKAGLRKLINKQIDEIASLRDETLLDDYLYKTEEFFNSLKTIEEVEIAKKILENQLDSYNQQENEKDNAKKILIEDELEKLDNKLISLSPQGKPIVNNVTIGIDITNLSNSNNIALIKKKINVPTFSFKNLFDNLKKLAKNVIDRIIYHKPKEIDVSSNSQSKEPQGKLSWDSFNQIDETHNENVIKNPYKVEGCTPISQKVDRPTPNGHNHDNSISKSVDKSKKTTRL